MNRQNKFRIVLRYPLDPCNNPEQSTEDLIQFARESHISEVMFLIAAEERSSGHITIEQAKPWVEVINKAKSLLAKEGVGVSLNPWTTLYHSARGRHLHPGQNFTLIVGENGVTDPMSPCPLCENFQKYLGEYYSFLATEINPIAIWIEDDWRLQNHDPSLRFGGCYCDIHMKRFSKRVGESVTREKLVEAILAKGKPHPWREEWLQLCGESLQEPIKKIADKIYKSNPDVRLGAMTSSPDSYSTEGRDWTVLMDNICQKNKYLIRPNMPPYTETPAITTPPTVTRHTIANLSKEADIYPELENSPRCGVYSESHRYTNWQIFNSLCFGSNGITINHFDDTGMGTFFDRTLGVSIGKCDRLFNALNALNIDDRNARGVKVLFHPEIARSIHSKDESTMKGLINKSTVWSPTFFILGISHGFTRFIDDSSSSVYAVGEQTLRCFSDSEILKLLSKRVLLDMTSVDIVLQRNLGEYLGVRKLEKVKHGETGYSFEELTDSDPTKYGGFHPRMCAQRQSDEIGKITYVEDAKILSNIFTGDLKYLFPGAAVFNNSLGGRIFTTAYPFHGERQFFMAYFNIVRHLFFRDLLFDMADDSSGIITVSGHPMHLYSVTVGDAIFCGLSNVTYDTITEFTLNMKANDIRSKEFLALSADGEWKGVSPDILIRENRAEARFQKELGPLEHYFLLIR